MWITHVIEGLRVKEKRLFKVYDIFIYGSITLPESFFHSHHIAVSSHNIILLITITYCIIYINCSKCYYCYIYKNDVVIYSCHITGIMYSWMGMGVIGLGLVVL